MQCNKCYVAQGWECPRCGHVYSPACLECSYCPIQLSTAAGVDEFLAGFSHKKPKEPEEEPCKT